MYQIDSSDLLVVHDAHPQYVSTIHAAELAAVEKDLRAASPRSHCFRARRAQRLGQARHRHQFRRHGYGDDGAIWGGEIFDGSVRDGFERVAHLRSASLPGGDAAATNPVQAAAGFLDSARGICPI